MLRPPVRVFLPIILAYVFCPVGQTQVGNSCKMKITGKQGVCKFVRDCPKAVQQSRVGIQLTNCGMVRNMPVVCCEGASPVSLPSRVTTTTPKPRNGKAEQRCREYTRSVVKVEYAAPLGIDVPALRVEIPKCEYEGLSLIVGGQKAGLAEFPHMALIGYGRENKWACGGTLISGYFVLTAAHCATFPSHGSARRVRLGELNIAEEFESESEDFDVAEFIRHPGYKRPQVYNDIALIRLSRVVTFDKFKRPACLWSSQNIEEKKAIATGWGVTQTYESELSNDLLKVGLDVVENYICNHSYQHETDHRRLPTGIESTMLCAVNKTKPGDTCQGDSGGPIQITHPNNKCIFYVIGVTSIGRACGSTETPSVYTRVSEYINWIESIVWP